MTPEDEDGLTAEEIRQFEKIYAEERVKTIERPGLSRAWANHDRNAALRAARAQKRGPKPAHDPIRPAGCLPVPDYPQYSITTRGPIVVYNSAGKALKPRLSRLTGQTYARYYDGFDGTRSVYVKKPLEKEREYAIAGYRPKS